LGATCDWSIIVLQHAFSSSADQRRMVLALSGLRMSWDEMRQIVRNPHTDRPVAKATFARVFKHE
jgi:hypothetical protein